jgi:hypothetical protein
LFRKDIDNWTWASVHSRLEQLKAQDIQKNKELWDPHIAKLRQLMSNAGGSRTGERINFADYLQWRVQMSGMRMTYHRDCFHGAFWPLILNQREEIFWGMAHSDQFLSTHGLGWHVLRNPSILFLVRKGSVILRMRLESWFA